MEILEIQQKKKELEYQVGMAIVPLLDKFQEETKVRIDSIRFNSITMEGGYEKFSGVDIKLNL